MEVAVSLASAGFCKTDAAINKAAREAVSSMPRAKRELIGINSALENPESNTFVGVGCAVPINTARALIQRLNRQ